MARKAWLDRMIVGTREQEQEAAHLEQGPGIPTVPDRSADRCSTTVGYCGRTEISTPGAGEGSVAEDNLRSVAAVSCTSSVPADLAGMADIDCTCWVLG